jgi:hypothetical protein
VTHVLDEFVQRRGSDDLVTCRLTFEILGLLPIDEMEINVEVVRPGRTIELLEATAVSRGRAIVRTRAWRLARYDTTAFAGGDPEPFPPPDDFAPGSLSSIWPGGYVASVELRRIDEPVPGRARVWLRTPLELVADEPASELARFVTLLDTANGVAVRVPPGSLFYPNVDLSAHFYRQPTAGWVGLDTSVVFGPDGQGLTSSVLYDVHGAVGRSSQMLTVRRTND